MTKEQITALINEKLKLNSPALKEAILNEIIAALPPQDEGYEEWEQYRFIKRKLDEIWQAVKKCSEQGIVTVKVAKMIASFPRPKALKKK